jgi:hypothetical protein
MRPLLIIRVSAMLGVLLFCGFLIWSQVKDFAKGKGRKRGTRVRTKEAKRKLKEDGE